MAILVISGAGCIGSAIVEGLLAQDYGVMVVDNPGKRRRTAREVVIDENPGHDAST
jgi:nucleoside-diphosphate-sugar epimerase